MVCPCDRLTILIKYVYPVASAVFLTLLSPSLGFQGPHVGTKDDKLGALVTGFVQCLMNFGACTDAGFERRTWIYMRKVWRIEHYQTLSGLQLEKNVCVEVVGVDESRPYVSFPEGG